MGLLEDGAVSPASADGLAEDGAVSPASAPGLAEDGAVSLASAPGVAEIEKVSPSAEGKAFPPAAAAVLPPAHGIGSLGT